MKVILLTLAALVVLSSTAQAQKRDYLLHTDENISRLKKQIEGDESVKIIWEEQYADAEKIAESNRLKASDCQLLGLAFRMTGEERFAEAVTKILMDYTARETWESAGLLSRTPPWQGGLNTSHTSFYIAMGFDCVYNYLTKEERKLIAGGLVRLGINPAREDWLLPGSSFHTFDTMGHNWWSACVYMAGFSSLAVRNEVPEAEQWAKDIAATATEWVNYSGSILQNKPSTFDSDGGFYESINYASYGVSQYLLFRYAFSQNLPNEKQVDLPILDKIADFFINTTYYTEDERIMSVNFGDSRLSANGNACVKLLWNLGYKKQRYAWYLAKVNAGTNSEALGLKTPNGLILNPDLPELKDDFLPDLPVSFLYADMGWASMRNSWEDNATMLAVKSGFTWNHTHADAGSYILFHRGENLIVDGGNCSYGNPLYTKYYCQSEAHNVVMFNSEGQNRKDPYFGVVNPGSLHNLIDGADFKYLLANATGPYSQLLARNYRHFIWVGDVILVFDDLLAHEPGQFESLLHYNGTSKRRGLDLSIKEGDAEVLVRPLYPETFPTGGLPHDFPEQMLLEEKLGYEDHHPDTRKPYWSISHFKETKRTKLVTAIILKTEKNEDDLPVVERFDGKDFLGVSITQNGKTTNVYLNLLADGRLKHRNSVINMNGWETDAYLTVLEFEEGKDETQVKNINKLFVGHGSYLRREGQVIIHSLSKHTTLVEGFQDKANVIFQGQPTATLHLYSPKNKSTIQVK